MFLTKKRCGRIKARGCADGRKQRETTKKEDASAPTVSIEAVMLSAVIDAMEERDVATVDIPGAFMQADIDEVVHVKFEGEIAEMLVKLDPALYRKYIKDENGKTVLCVELLKALCGTLPRLPYYFGSYFQRNWFHGDLSSIHMIGAWQIR